MEYRKKQGEEWIVLTRQGGGQIEVAAKDEAVMNEDGVYLFHNDAARTTTFVPMFAIAWVRSYWPKGSGGQVSDLRGREFELGDAIAGYLAVEEHAQQQEWDDEDDELAEDAEIVGEDAEE